MSKSHETTFDEITRCATQLVYKQFAQNSVAAFIHKAGVEGEYTNHGHPLVNRGRNWQLFCGPTTYICWDAAAAVYRLIAPPPPLKNETSDQLGADTFSPYKHFARQRQFKIGFSYQKTLEAISKTKQRCLSTLSIIQLVVHFIDHDLAYDPFMTESPIL